LMTQGDGHPAPSLQPTVPYIFFTHLPGGKLAMSSLRAVEVCTTEPTVAWLFTMGTDVTSPGPPHVAHAPAVVTAVHALTLGHAASAGSALSNPCVSPICCGTKAPPPCCCCCSARRALRGSDMATGSIVPTGPRPFGGRSVSHGREALTAAHEAPVATTCFAQASLSKLPSGIATCQVPSPGIRRETSCSGFRLGLKRRR
jgi:hypothetical protein